MDNDKISIKAEVAAYKYTCKNCGHTESGGTFNESDLKLVIKTGDSDISMICPKCGSDDFDIDANITVS
jgi:Zn finger protein HypA/HybF involved in hydrogenase expression